LEVERRGLAEEGDSRGAMVSGDGCNVRVSGDGCNVRVSGDGEGRFWLGIGWWGRCCWGVEGGG